MLSHPHRQVSGWTDQGSDGCIQKIKEWEAVSTYCSLTHLLYGRSKVYVCALKRRIHLRLFNNWLECISNLLHRLFEQLDFGGHGGKTLTTNHNVPGSCQAPLWYNISNLLKINWCNSTVFGTMIILQSTVTDCRPTFNHLYISLKFQQYEWSLAW